MNGSGALARIITDTDITRRVAAKLGLLDSAKCLTDATFKLEKSHSSKGSNTAEGALKQALYHQGDQTGQAAALQALRGLLMAPAFGNKKPFTLRSQLAGKPSTVVRRFRHSFCSQRDRECRR